MEMFPHDDEKDMVFNAENPDPDEDAPCDSSGKIGKAGL